MKARHGKTLEAVFSRPTRSGIIFAELEALIVALGGDVRGGQGSRLVFELNGKRLYVHRPHPGKEAKRYQVEDLRAFLETEGFEP